MAKMNKHSMRFSSTNNKADTASTEQSGGVSRRNTVMKFLVPTLLGALMLSACSTTQRPLEDPHPRLQSVDPNSGEFADMVLVTADSNVEDPGIEETEFYAGEGRFIDEEAHAHLGGAHAREEILVGCREAVDGGERAGEVDGVVLFTEDRVHRGREERTGVLTQAQVPFHTNIGSRSR